MIGTSLGPYKIIEQLGAGGMGEVYRAHDPRLERDVAIKVLPEDFAADPERLARFEREAKLLAQLNHTNIATIHGLEEAEGTRFIAMECVEGETLAQRLAASGRIDIDESLDIARQIAEALEAAHESGVIHRDLKPANVKITPDGKAKVLDFGLAKAWGVTAASGSAAGSAGISPDLSHSPTMMDATRTGVILGTAAYMSPEQARGKPVDKRTDIWAFGCVLYEMLAGKRSFEGETVSDAMASILKEEPNWEALPDTVGSEIRRLLARCLDKSPQQRLRDIGEARVSLQNLADASSLKSGPRSDPRSQVAGIPGLRALSKHTWALLALAFVPVALVSYSIGAGGDAETGTAATPILDLPISAPAGEMFGYGYRSSLAISHAGRRIAFITSPAAGDQTGGQLWIQDLATSTPPRPIAGATDAAAPFFSPDGDSLAFFDRDSLQRVDLSGAQDPRALAPASVGPGGFWADDGTIVFFQEIAGPLQRITPDGNIEQVVAPQAGHHYWYPSPMPGGEHVLVSQTDGESNSLAMLSLETGEGVTLIENGYYGRYVPTGHILYARGSELVAVRYDAATGALGDPRVVATSMAVDHGEFIAEYAVADDGTLIYLQAQPGGRWLHRLSPGGTRAVLNVEPLEPPGDYLSFDVSLSGDRLAFSRDDRDLWIFDLAQNQIEKRLTWSGVNWHPRWSRDGERILFNSAQSTQWSFREIATEPGSEPEPVLDDEYNKWPGDRAPDGTIAYHRADDVDPGDLYLLSPDGDSPEPFLETPERESGPTFSPDGSWIAYESSNTDQLEVYVTTYPDRTGSEQISIGGGSEPRFQADGSAIFYRNRDTIYRVQVIDPDALRFSDPQPFVQGVDRSAWDVTADGSAIIALEQRATPRLRLVLGAAARFDD